MDSFFQDLLAVTVQYHCLFIISGITAQVQPRQDNVSVLQRNAGDRHDQE